ncbi:penicillin-binding protein activator LpoB [Pseudomonas sp. gcc21]|uniref:penicillin-binding protein activator LpoB n=1 Tax=Pseudomonas sp. gcc21 TaxID=2726989 RepID=UPI0014519685|nr:penicillin-binding protein activator LpoB [Pseudomonas sp. gcc21]QJD57896.1 penicillin-binding protein activator LpoB [Pseudomonas sp. gcc21]
MQSIRCLSLAMATLLATGCTSITSKESPVLPADADWGLMPIINYSQAPQAGERSEQILLSILSKENIQPQVYPFSEKQDAVLLDDQTRFAEAMAWARQQDFDYVVSGSVEEWQYKNGLDGEPAVGISLRVIDPSTGKVIWSNSAARAGWSRESLAGTAQKVLAELVDDLRIE